MFPKYGCIVLETENYIDGIKNLQCKDKDKRRKSNRIVGADSFLRSSCVQGGEGYTAILYGSEICEQHFECHFGIHKD